MGFLDHSTNNIIIDAVLTDVGRQKLAQNNGQFRIEFFSLGDDEIDYTIIQKYGRPVGKEKIMKNTPIFEAQTKQSSAIKSRLITLSNPSIYKMPSLYLDTQNTNGVVSLGNNTTPQVITISQKTSDGSTYPSELQDSTFTVYMNDMFLYIPSGASLGAPEPLSRVRGYSVIKTNTNGVTGATFSVQRQTTVKTSDFTNYGIAGTITTPVTIVGDQTGLRIDIKVSLTNA